MSHHSLLPLLALLAATPAARAQYLLAVESTNDRVLLLDANDGSIVNPLYIDLTVAAAQTPVEAMPVGGEIWVTDQLADKIMRFSLDGTTYLGSITAGLDNIRGLEYAAGEVFVSNSGTTNGAPGKAVIRFSPAGVNLGSFATPDPFDVVSFGGDLLLTDIDNEDLVRYTTGGTFVSILHGSGPLNFPEQAALRANGNVLVSSFSAPWGVYEYDAATGAQLNYYAIGNGNRGVAELGNGRILWTDGSGIHTYDPGTASISDVLTGVSGRYVSRFAGTQPQFTPFCAGDGSGTACPCGNASAPGAREGCLNSLGTGGKLVASGFASLASDSVMLSGSQMPNSSALYFQGTTQLNGGAGAAFGDGLRCAGGTVVRLGTKANVAGASQYPAPGDLAVSLRGGVAAPGTRTYQVWYRNAAAFCTAATFNLTSAVQVAWGA